MGFLKNQTPPPTFIYAPQEFGTEKYAYGNAYFPAHPSSVPIRQTHIDVRARWISKTEKKNQWAEIKHKERVEAARSSGG